MAAASTEPGREQEAVTRLSRVGFDNVLGYVEGGFQAWKDAGQEIDTVDRISAAEFASKVDLEKDKVVDVRREGEYNAEHVDNAYSLPLAYINTWIKDVNPAEHFYMHCASGFRSIIAASILQSRGYRNFTEIGGGFKAIKETPIPCTDYICQSKVFNK